MISQMKTEKRIVDKFYKDVFRPAYDIRWEVLRKAHRKPSQLDYKWNPRMFIDNLNKWIDKLNMLILSDVNWMDNITKTHGISYAVNFKNKDCLELGLKDNYSDIKGGYYV